MNERINNFLEKRIYKKLKKLKSEDRKNLTLKLKTGKTYYDQYPSNNCNIIIK